MREIGRCECIAIWLLAVPALAATTAVMLKGFDVRQAWLIQFALILAVTWLVFLIVCVWWNDWRSRADQDW